MAVYRCVKCDEFFDGDYHPCEDAGKFKPEWRCELLCLHCHDDLKYEQDKEQSWREE